MSKAVLCNYTVPKAVLCNCIVWTLERLKDLSELAVNHKDLPSGHQHQHLESKQSAPCWNLHFYSLSRCVSLSQCCVSPRVNFSIPCVLRKLRYTNSREEGSGRHGEDGLLEKIGGIQPTRRSPAPPVVTTRLWQM